MTITYNYSHNSVASQISSHPQSEVQIEASAAPLSWCSLKMRPRQVKIAFALLTTLLVSGCETIDLKRVTYDFLRQEDCRRNDVDVYEFCSRTFVFEYDEYEQLRQEYIRSEEDKTRRDQANRELYHSLYNEGP